MSSGLPCHDQRVGLRTNFIQLLNNMETKRKMCNVKPTVLNISTMTIVGNLSCSNVDIDKIFTDFRISGGKCAFQIQLGGESFPVNIKMPEDASDEKKNLFFNQATFYFLDSNSNKSFKVFRNGKLHGTGCKSPFEFAEIAHGISGFLHKGHYALEPVLNTFDIALINANFYFAKIEALSLGKMKEAVLQHPGVDAYRTENHAGLFIKYKTPDGNSNSITIFTSGHVNLMGIKTFENIWLCFEFIVRLVNEKYEDFKCVSFSDYKPRKIMKVAANGVPLSIALNLQI